MVIFVNPKAGGGSALTKWRRYGETLPYRVSPPTAFIMNGRASTIRQIRRELEKGECQFVAAGGDGTVNFLLNTILSHVSADSVSSLRFGAVGLGSSNDFHKPFRSTNGHTSIPTKIDFSSAEPRDVGYLTFEDLGREVTRYFLVNASAGVTADANYFFNHPDRLLAVFKKINTSSAIMYAALRTIAKYRNQEVAIDSPETGEFAIALTNIGIVKNPHFSGNLSYDTPLDFQNGRFDVHVTYGMTRREVLDLLHALGEREFGSITKKVSWRTSSVNLCAQRPFMVEYDGEIISTSEVHFGILPSYLKVCTC